MLEHLRGRDLAGKRIVVQEHGQSLSMAAHALRRRGRRRHHRGDLPGAERRRPGADVPPGRRDRRPARCTPCTFTSAPAVAALMEAAGSTGRRDEVIGAFQADVLASCVGPVTAAAFEMWGVPSIYPDRSRLAAMVKQLETELPSRSDGQSVQVAGHTLLLHGDEVLLDGVAVTPDPGAARRAAGAAGQPRPRGLPARAARPRCRPAPPASEHAVEMAVARLRSALGTRLVQTVVKRGYRLAVAP